MQRVLGGAGLVGVGAAVLALLAVPILGTSRWAVALLLVVGIGFAIAGAILMISAAVHVRRTRKRQVAPATGATAARLQSERTGIIAELERIDAEIATNTDLLRTADDYSAVNRARQLRASLAGLQNRRSAIVARLDANQVSLHELGAGSQGEV